MTVQTYNVEIENLKEEIYRYLKFKSDVYDDLISKLNQSIQLV